LKKILVTGAGGFIGSHLAEKLVKQGFSVKALIKYNSKNNWGWLENSELLKDIEIVTGDIRDYESVYNSLSGCSAVFHLAALIGIPYSYFAPLEYIKTNVEGTYNVLQASRKLQIDNIVITSTSETYGSAQYTPIDEKHPLVGQSPYSATKIAADQLALSYYLSFKLPVKIVRPFNTYGPRQSARAIIPTIITQVLSGSNKVVLGNTQPTRDLTYVEDCTKGYLEIFKADKLWGEVINIGTGVETSIENLAKMIIKLTGSDAKIVTNENRVRPDNSEVSRLLCDYTKLQQATGWTHKNSLESGLKKTIEWFRQFQELYKPDIYNV
jgi:NAD dependent epimerase/dehydratase